MIHDILTLGAGSAGLVAALALRRRLPILRVRVVCSSELDVIGVGTIPLFYSFFSVALGSLAADFIAKPNRRASSADVS